MLNNTQNNTNTNNRVAAGFMLGAVILYSMRPFIYSIGDASSSPFLFNAVINLFSMVTCIIFLVTSYRHLTFNKRILKKIFVNCRRPEIFLASMSAFDYALFALAINYIDISVATILFETWPFFMIFITAWLFKTEGRYRKINAALITPVILGFMGFSFVIFSSEQYLDVNTITINGFTLFWSAVAISGALLTACSSPYTLRWGANLSQSEANHNTKLEFFFIIAGFAITRLIGALISGILGISFDETINGTQISTAIICGLLITGIASILLRHANMTTNNLGVNALLYATPIFALIWLGIFSLINVPHVDFLIIGTIAIIAANLLINFETSLSIAYKALIIALWACGTMVYLRDGFVLTDHTTIVTLFATMFSWIFSFPWGRLVRRATKEKDIALQLSHKISSFAKLNKINKDDAKKATEALLAIDSHKTPDELHGAYNALKQSLNTPTSPHGDATPLAEGNPREYNLAPLDELEADIDMLTHSKQQGMNFGELMALGLSGILLICSLLFFQPLDATGWGGFFIEIYSLILATGALFLFFTILDLQRDRHRPILKKVKKEVKEDTDTSASSFSIVLRDATNRGFEQRVSVIVCATIILAYGWLFWGKWLA